MNTEQLQRDLQQARAELAHLSHAVSHDLRASLRHVNAYVQIIREDLDGQGNSELLSHLDQVTQSARHMGLQIDGLAEMARLTRVDLQPKPLDLAPMLRDVCAELAPTLEGRPVQWQLAPDFPSVMGDPDLIRRVLLAILSNAVKFTLRQNPAYISVAWAAVDSGQCCVSITDNGVGFNPAYTQKLFHVFQRLHGAREFEGLGMGLALSRKIIERHGGTVSAQGAVDAGCCVSFSLALV
jgi:light-regulated signal transduction histidine kinase (bacteriophytochrome)